MDLFYDSIDYYSKYKALGDANSTKDYETLSTEKDSSSRDYLLDS